jgi:ribose transport system permease protein
MTELQQIQNPEPEPLPELSFRDQMKQRFDFSWTYIFVVLVALIVIFTIWHGTKFFDRTNFRNIALDSSQLMLLAIGMTFVIITAGIDLSVSAVLVFSAVVGAKVMSRLSGSPEQVKAYDFPNQDYGIPIGLAAAVLCGLLWGTLNGVLITKLRLPPFIVTLGTLGMALGLGQIIAGGQTVPYVPYDVQNWVGARRFFGWLPLLVVITTIIVIIAMITLSMTRFGRFTFAIGSNQAAARRAGINVDRHLIKVYAFSGTMAGTAGAFEVARFATASTASHSADNLNAVSAVVIGGTSLFGGMGSIFGSVIGTFIPTVLRNGLIIGGIDPFWQQVTIGAILIVAVYFDQRRRKASERM